MENPSSDRRDAIRLTLNADLRYQVRGQPVSQNAVCNNISAKGISFVSEDFIAPATPLMLEINILSRVLHPIGRVAWISMVPHSNRKRVGVEFLEMDPTERKYLEDFVSLKEE